MTRRVAPSLNLAVLCSDVEFDGNGRPFRLVEPLYALAAVPDDRGKLHAPELLVYAQLEDEHAFGTFWFVAEVRTESGIVIPTGRTRPMEATFTGNPDPLQPFEHVFSLREVVFPEPGRYYVHVMCNHMSLHSREQTQPAPRLRVIPAERSGG